MTLPVAQAAEILWRHWQHTTQLDELPADCRPRTRADGYAIQAAVARLSGYSVAGWKIAATSAAGQRHINVDGPLAGRLLSGRRLMTGTPVPLAGNVMHVAEAEFAFRLATPLPARHTPYAVDEVMAAVVSMHPAIEVPDSRYTDVARVGGPQLIADTACACWFMLGPAAPASWRTHDLSSHRVIAYLNGQVASEGGGANVLGDPRVALTWLANELVAYGEGLHAGDVVITGTCVPPVAVAPGDRVHMDFGDLGSVDARFEA